MDVVSSLTGLIGALNGARQIIGSAIDARDQSLVRESLAEIREKLLSATDVALDVKVQQIEFAEMYAAIQSKVHELERENSELKRQKIDLDRYVLHDLSPGIPVYALRPEAQGEEPMHYLCPKCRHDGKKSILNRRQGPQRTEYLCPACKTIFLSREPGHGRYPSVAGLA